MVKFMAETRGGARPGAGRPKGAHETRTRELVRKATEGGITPLEVLMKHMRFYDGLAEIKLVELHETENGKEKSKLLRIVDGFQSKARECAKDAAPYVHPKLNAISAPGGGPIQISLQVEFVTAAN